MRQTVFFLVSLLCVFSAHALPDCPSDVQVRWHNCVGTATSDDGTKYVGEFQDDKFSGQGTITFSDGGKYVGEFKDGIRDGRGTHTRADGREYVGEFKDGVYNGRGTFTFPDGYKIYTGEFKDGMPNGQGAETFADGSKYVGEFKDGVYNGRGTFIFPDGREFLGEWRNGEVVEPEESADFWDLLPEKDRYNWIKDQSSAGNLEMFQIYEEKTSFKVLNVCADFSGWRVMAHWDLDIKDEQDAFDVASESCVGGRAVLLGYSTDQEYRF